MEQLIDPYPPDELSARHYTAWQLIKSYWQSQFRFPAYLFFGIVVIMTVSLVGLEVALNYWYNYFYNALQEYDKHGVIRLLVVFFGIATIYIIIGVYRFYISQLFSLRWRKWLTECFVSKWLKNHSYYLIEQFDQQTDNPDQRIQEDIGALVNSSLDLSLGLITAITTFLAFIYILWQLSGDMTISLGALGTWHLHGYLVWVGICYALIGTIITIKLGRPLIPLNFEQQRREASFRFAAVDLRTHAEHVALYKAERSEQGVLSRLFGRVLDNWYLIILRQKLLLWFTLGYNQASVLLPLLVVLPQYFDKVFLLGGLVQSLKAFTSVQDSLSFLVNSYTRIAEWKAVTNRLTTFVNHMEDATSLAKKENRLMITPSNESSILINRVSVYTPQKVCLLENINESFHQGERYLLEGASGIGKSTLIRTIAGIWPYANGEIVMPKQLKMMYLPQRPYMPIGSLLEAVYFPNEQLIMSDSAIVAILRDCRLEKLTDRLHEVAAWSAQLSPGEQQRITLARILLEKPDWIFLDESTSQLDIENEDYFYRLLQERLPQLSFISVGHRPSLKQYHNHIVDMKKYVPAQETSLYY